MFHVFPLSFSFFSTYKSVWKTSSRVNTSVFFSEPCFKMKLLTHNMLTSNIIKGVTKGYPLGINAGRVEVQQVDFNPEFITRLIPKLDFAALRQAATQLGHGEGLPDALPESVEANEPLQKALHHALLQVEILEGDLVCPETGRKFPIQNGIPNMLLNEDEVS